MNNGERFGASVRRTDDVGVGERSGAGEPVLLSAALIAPATRRIDGHFISAKESLAVKSVFNELLNMLLRMFRFAATSYQSQSDECPNRKPNQFLHEIPRKT